MFLPPLDGAVVAVVEVVRRRRSPLDSPGRSMFPASVAEALRSVPS